MNNNEKKITNRSRKPIFKTIAMLIIICSLILGMFFSSLKFSENIKLGSDFKGYYSALVAVDNLNEESSTNGQPNGDSSEGAKALNERLNPMGNNQIIIEKAGKNFLKVLSPVEAYQSETIFKNQIQKNGGIVLLNSETYKDLQITGTDTIERKGINEYFTGAKASSIKDSNLKEPAISYSLNGDTFKTLLTGGSEEQEGGGSSSLGLFILLDADGFYNDIRNYYNLIKGDKEDRIEEFFKVIINPMRDIYKDSSKSDKVKQILFDLFYGEWSEKTSSGVNVTYRGSLIDPTSAPNNALLDSKGFLEIVDTFKYVSETSKYVYDSNAVTKDFQTAGRYESKVKLWTSANVETPSTMRVDELFSEINPTILNFAKEYQNSFNSQFLNNIKTSYFLFDGTVTETKTGAGAGYIENNNLITKVDTETKSRVGASLFNASGKGFVFTVNSIATINGKVTNLMLISAIIFILIIIICMIVYMGFFYRILGLFSMIITLSIIGITLLSLSWFNLTVGPETIISAFILITLNMEIFSALFESMKESFFLKQRGLKTSFNISIKENIGIAADLVIALLIPTMCMFWISSNAIRSMAIMLAMGSFFTVLFTILIAIILFKLLMNSQLITNKAYLFALNTDFASQGNFIINYKITRLQNKISKLKSKSNFNKELLKKFEDRLNKLNEKLNFIKIKDEEKSNKKQLLIKEKINKKIDKYNLNIEKLNKDKSAKKIQSLNFKISELIFLRDDQTQNIIEKEGEIEISPTEKLKIKTIEKNIKSGAKIISLFSIIMLSLSIVLGFVFGLNFDSTFGGRTDYTLWGDNTSELYYKISDENFDDYTHGNEDKLKEIYNYKTDLIEAHEKFKAENSNLIDVVKLDETKTVSEFLNYVFSDSFYVDYLAQNLSSSKAYKKNNFTVSYGDKFIFNDTTTGTATNQNWITLTVYTQNLKQSAIIKRMFNNFGVDKSVNIGSQSGFITKAINPATMLWTLEQIAISIAVIILALIIYILIRFKWTYYIAMIVSIIVAPLVTVAILTTMQVPLGNVAIIGIVSSIIFTIISLFMIFGKARSLIASKNEVSLVNYFKKEIEIIYDTKSFKNQMNDELFKLKNEMRLEIKTNKLSKEEKKKLKLEFKEIKHNKKIDFKKVKKDNKIKINRVSKQNNYLSEVLVKTFKFGFIRCWLLIGLYSLLGILLVLSMPTIMAFGVSIIIGVIVACLFVLFISVPLWVLFEQIRIRNRLARKRFINGLYVSNEEQIIEGIND
ncbi:protein translocase SecDF, variant type [Spiroplasma diminutum]|uniref:protein translocase SecDF, variant type n=1 Tax=Spiroplasma diminutum TaxID=216936 RepID=UPI0005A1AD78|nr:protein translocase SecDF, variant type [Spiroplasma diminutum]